MMDQSPRRCHVPACKASNSSASAPVAARSASGCDLLASSDRILASELRRPAGRLRWHRKRSRASGRRSGSTAGLTLTAASRGLKTFRCPREGWMASKRKSKRGSSRPTMVQVAEIAEVSTFTVSAVVNGTSQVSNSFRQRVEAAIRSRALSERVGRSRRTGQTHTVGLSIGDITNPLTPTSWRGRSVRPARGGVRGQLGGTECNWTLQDEQIAAPTRAAPGWTARPYRRRARTRGSRARAARCFCALVALIGPGCWWATTATRWCSTTERRGGWRWAYISSSSVPADRARSPGRWRSSHLARAAGGVSRGAWRGRGWRRTRR